MPLHPQVESFLKEMDSLDQKPIDQCTPEEFRRRMRVNAEADGTPGPIGEVEDRVIEGPGGTLPIRIYRPAELASAGALVYYHGGGWVGGDLETHEALCRAIATAAGCLVIAVDYRLAPEHKYPAAVEDAFASFQWVCGNAAQLGVDPQQIAVGGDSAGGNLAAVVALMASDRGGDVPCLQVLIYPVTNQDFSSVSYEKYAEEYGLTTAGMQWFWKSYLPEEAKTAEPYASPLQADSLAGVSPALVLLAECDVLYSEGEQYADRLVAEGVVVERECYAGMIHGFLVHVGTFEVAHIAIERIATALQKRFSS